MQEMNTNFRHGMRGARRLLAVAPFAAVRTGNQVHLAIVVTKAVTSFVEVRGGGAVRHCQSLLCSPAAHLSARLHRHLLQDVLGCPALLRRFILGRRGSCCYEVAVQQHCHCSITPAC